MNYRNTVTIDYLGDTYKVIFEADSEGRYSCIVRRWLTGLNRWGYTTWGESYNPLVLKAYRKMAKKYRVRYASFFGENVSILDKQPRATQVNYHLAMWAFMNSAQVALETTIEKLLREFQHENRYPANRHSEFKALEQIAVGMLCQVQIYGGCQPYKLRKGFKLHFNDRGWNQHLDNPWIKRATRFMRSKLGKQIMAMSV